MIDMRVNSGVSRLSINGQGETRLRPGESPGLRRHGSRGWENVIPAAESVRQALKRDSFHRLNGTTEEVAEKPGVNTKCSHSG